MRNYSEKANVLFKSLKLLWRSRRLTRYTLHAHFFCINLPKFTSEKTSECRFFSLEVEDLGFARGNNVNSCCLAIPAKPDLRQRESTPLPR